MQHALSWNRPGDKTAAIEEYRWDDQPPNIDTRASPTGHFLYTWRRRTRLVKEDGFETQRDLTRRFVSCRLRHVRPSRPVEDAGVSAIGSYSVHLSYEQNSPVKRLIGDNPWWS